MTNRPSAIVTGGATGVGAACARLLAERGFNVTVNFNRSAESAAAVVDDCRELGADAIAVQGDVSEDRSCRAIAEQTRDAFGSVDVLVNNAGVTHFADARDLEALEKSHFLHIMSVNVVGAYQMSRAVAASMGHSALASIVNVSSHSGFSGVGSSSAYAASKGALNTLTLALARALAPRIRVNAVCPGFVDTDWMAPKLSEDELATFKQRVASIAPLERIVSPQDVADAVHWFATGAKSVTGQLLVIDGGNHLTVGNPL